MSYSAGAGSLGSVLGVTTGATASVDWGAAGVLGALVGAFVGALVGDLVGAGGVALGVLGGTYGGVPPDELLEPDEVCPLDEEWLPLELDPLLWLPLLLWLPELWVDWWLEPLWWGFVVGLVVGFVVGFLVGFLVGFGGGAWVCGGSGGGGGAAVGVIWVGRTAAGATPATPPDPDALCGHQATRHAARPSNAATVMRATYAKVLFTTPSLAP